MRCCRRGHKAFPRLPGTATVTRAEIDADALLKLLLVLVIAWLALEVIGEILGLFAAVLGPLQPLLGLVLVVLIVLYLTDRL